MKRKVFTIVLVPIIALILLGVGIYSLDEKLNLGLVDRVRSKIEELQNQQEQTTPEDTTPLEVEVSNTTLTVLEPSTSLTVIANKEIKTDESQRFKLIFNSESEGKKYYVLEVYNIGIGTASVTIPIKDSADNTKEIILVITREEYALPYGLSQISDWENSAYTIDGNSLTAKVDKTHKLIEDYAPTNLVDLNKDKLLYTNATGIMLRSDAADYLELMLKELQKEKGKNVVIASGYRSILDQFRQYVSWVRQLGQDEADKVSARPGYSEHSLGTSVDFMSQDSGFNFTNNFDQTEAGKWLKENSYRYGFIQSYPEGKEGLTGYNYEAWHYRYIGVDNAKAVKESGLTLREWLATQ